MSLGFNFMLAKFSPYLCTICGIAVVHHIRVACLDGCNFICSFALEKNVQFYNHQFSIHAVQQVAQYFGLSAKFP